MGNEAETKIEMDALRAIISALLTISPARRETIIESAMAFVPGPE